MPNNNFFLPNTLNFIKLSLVSRKKSGHQSIIHQLFLVQSYGKGVPCSFTPIRFYMKTLQISHSNGTPVIEDYLSFSEPCGSRTRNECLIIPDLSSYGAEYQRSKSVDKILRSSCANLMPRL